MTQAHPDRLGHRLSAGIGRRPSATSRRAWTWRRPRRIGSPVLELYQLEQSSRHEAALRTPDRSGRQQVSEVGERGRYRCARVASVDGRLGHAVARPSPRVPIGRHTVTDESRAFCWLSRGWRACWRQAVAIGGPLGASRGFHMILGRVPLPRIRRGASFAWVGGRSESGPLRDRGYVCSRTTSSSWRSTASFARASPTSRTQTSGLCRQRATLCALVALVGRRVAQAHSLRTGAQGAQPPVVRRRR